jgi:glycosyltransferase involved in cell wall biosynthesis
MSDKVNTKYHIVLVSNTTWNIFNFRLNVIESLLNDGHKVSIISPVDEYIKYKENYPSIQHYNLYNLERDSTNPIQDIKLGIELYKLYKKISPDIIVHYTVKPNIYGGIAAGLAKIPTIAVVTGLGYSFIHKGLIKFTTKRLYKFASAYHSVVVFENFDDKQLFNDLNLVSEQKSISIKGCGVNTSYYIPTKSIRESEKIVFTFIGRLLYDKGVVEFIEAASIVKQTIENAEFWLVGELDQGNPSMIKKADLVNWVKEETVIYKGTVKDVRPIIGNSNCIVLPSYREGLPRVLLEASSMAKPIITTNVAGCRETVDNGKNGFSVPVKNSQALANAMLEFISLGKEKWIEMGKYGRRKAISEFDDKLIAKQIKQIIFQTLEKSYN